MIQLEPLCAVCPPGSPLEEYEVLIGLLLEAQRDVIWQLGDLANGVRRDHPDDYEQAYPAGKSPDAMDRYRGVASAYKPHERNIDATWTIHMQNSKHPDRVAIVAAAVEAGQTSDENRRKPAPVETPAENPPVAESAEPETQTEPAAESTPARTRWLLAVDINYYIHRQFQVEGMAAGSTVVSWLIRVIDRLMEKGLTDVVCCFDGPNNHRREITIGWEQPYKERTEKAPELVTLLNQVPTMLNEKNILIVTIDGMEADDVMASYSRTFDGKVTLLTADKDLRQCLSGHCNMLIDVTWEENPDTREWLPVYNWVNVAKHLESVTYASAKVSGISPEAWPHFQAIAGDSVDKIRGVEGIGAKGAMDLILAHGTVQGVIEACKSGLVALTKKKIEAVLEFEPFAEGTLLLTTMRTDLQVPSNTTIGIKELIEKRS